MDQLISGLTVQGSQGSAVSPQVGTKNAHNFQRSRGTAINPFNCKREGICVVVYGTNRHNLMCWKVVSLAISTHGTSSLRPKEKYEVWGVLFWWVWGCFCLGFFCCCCFRGFFWRGEGIFVWGFFFTWFGFLVCLVWVGLGFFVVFGLVRFGSALVLVLVFFFWCVSVWFPPQPTNEHLHCTLSCAKPRCCLCIQFYTESSSNLTFRRCQEL